MAVTKTEQLLKNLGALAVKQRQIEEQRLKILSQLPGQTPPVSPLVGVTDPCPDLSDPNASTSVYLCQLAIRVLYNLGQYATCQDYIDAHNACTPPA